MPFLSAIPLKFWLTIAVLACIGGLLWHDNHLSKLYKAQKAATEQVEASLEQERANRKIEQDDRRRADESAKSLQAELDRIAAAPKPVSVWCRTASVPSTASQSGTASDPNAASARPSTAEPVRDIGSLLRDVWIETQSNYARQNALIQWENERTH